EKSSLKQKVVDTENEKVQHFCSLLTLYLMVNFMGIF
ncbi:unnamed protein product, partial [Arabidopsis halleri]